MIYYLGDKVDVVGAEVKKMRNKAGSWKYGYNEEIDTVIISKDGTLGDVFNVCGLNIGLPSRPEKKHIINHDKTPANQKWQREQLPQGLNEETYLHPKYADYVDEQFDKREYGVWIYLNGKPVYLTGTYWFFIQWYREESEYPRLRIIQNELMIFWEACKADERCYGMDYVKNRRFGASALGNNEILESGSIHENKALGMISKKGPDAKKIFLRLVKSFKRLPPFFKPETGGDSNPKTELVFTEQSRKRKAGEAVTEGGGLDTTISWHNTELNAMDGEKIFRSLVDEAGKWAVDKPFSTYWYIVKTSHRVGSSIVGKSMVVSTVNEKKKGGAEFEKIWDDSDITKRNANGQTKSGLYPIFIDAALCQEGFFDEYGFTIFDDPKKPVMNDLGKMITEGAVTYLTNELESLADDPEKQNEFRRQFPRTINDAFRDSAEDCAFNVVNIQDQIEHNKVELHDVVGDYTNDEILRGNFHWKDGIQDTEVIWTPDAVRGRFYIAKNAFPPVEYRNLKVKKPNKYDGRLSWAPLNDHIGSMGVDPYDRSKTADGRGSKGAIHIVTKYNTGPFPNEVPIVEYIDRPETVKQFYEDVIMCAVFFSIPFLPELSIGRFSTYIYDRGYRNFALNNPFKHWNELSPEEKEFGGVPPQDAKIGDQQFYAVEAYVEDYVGIARNEQNRGKGKMGFFPFTRTLVQLKDVDPLKRTKYDAYISFSLALLANQKRVKTSVDDTQKKPIKIPYRTYNHTA
jgi:hypothetical protein